MSYRGKSKGSYDSQNRQFNGVGGKKAKLTSLHDPRSGAPLEPSLEYGSTILYSPHSGEFVNISVPEGNIVDSRLAKTEREGRRIVSSYVRQAADAVRRDASLDAVLDAFRLLTQAVRSSPISNYPEADLQKIPLFKQLNEVYNMVAVDVGSAQESEGAERNQFLKLAQDRILAVERALVPEMVR